MPPDPAVDSIRTQAFRDGVRAALGAPAGVLFAGMVGFGALGHASQVDLWLMAISSWTVLALPGQVVLVEMLASGASVWAIVLAVTLTSTRFVTMVVTLFSQFHERDRTPRLYGMVHLVAMTAWALSMRDFQHMPRERRASFFFGMALVCTSVTLPATVLGYYLAAWVSAPVTLALVLINPLFFLLTFTEVRPWANRLAILLGCTLGPMFYLWDKDSSLLVTGLVAGSVAYWVDRQWIRRRHVVVNKP
jgi:predicted branched-subunit amino acid permease